MPARNANVIVSSAAPTVLTVEAYVAGKSGVTL